MVRAGGPAPRLGANWVYRFLIRHPELKRKRSSKLKRARVRSSTKEAFNGFFNLLEYYVAEKQIKVNNIANIDKYGL